MTLLDVCVFLCKVPTVILSHLFVQPALSLLSPLGSPPPPPPSLSIQVCTVTPVELARQIHKLRSRMFLYRDCLPVGYIYIYIFLYLFISLFICIFIYMCVFVCACVRLCMGGVKVCWGRWWEIFTVYVHLEEEEEEESFLEVDNKEKKEEESDEKERKKKEGMRWEMRRRFWRRDERHKDLSPPPPAWRASLLSVAMRTWRSLSL